MDNGITNFAGRESGCKSVIHQLEDWQFVVIIPSSCKQGDTPGERRVIRRKSCFKMLFLWLIYLFVTKKKNTAIYEAMYFSYICVNF